MRTRWMLAFVWAALLAVFSPRNAEARDTTLTAVPTGGKPIRIDGLLREWGGRMTELSHRLQGQSVDASGKLAYDDTHLFIAMRVSDTNIARTRAAGSKEDHATLRIAFPKASGGYADHEVHLYPGDPGKLPGLVVMNGKPVSGAKLVEAPEKNGFLMEARVPWSAFPEAARVRVGLRAVLVYTDASRAGAVRGVVATGRAKAASGMPSLLLEAEQGLDKRLIVAKNLSGRAAFELFGNVAGDAALERVAVFGPYLSIVGHHYRSGKEFYFAELGVASDKMVVDLKLVDFDGDGRDEIVVQKRIGKADEYRQVIQVLKVGASEVPEPIFSHETAIKTEEGLIENRVKISGGAKPSITIEQDKAKGFEPDTFAEPTTEGMASALLPWQSVKSRSFGAGKEGFELLDEDSWSPKVRKSGGARPGGAAKPAVEAPPPPRPPTADEMQDRLYALYRKERNVGNAEPRFDFVTDVADDTRTERIVIHGRDIVIFGKGFRGGTSYAFIAVGVADPKDIIDATARDLTGDGKAEIIVRAVMRTKASEALGGDVVDRYAFLVYKVIGMKLMRIFGAETGRALKESRILGGVVLEPAERGLMIELRPGRALGWTEDSYPFPPDTTQAGGLEPLLLPWTDMPVRRYRFDGGAYQLQ